MPVNFIKNGPAKSRPQMTINISVATINVMPKVSAKCKVQSAKPARLTIHYALITNHFKVRPGFTLIEVVLSIFIILAIVTIILIASGSYATSHGSNLQGIAAKIASREMENLRNTPFDSLVNCDPPDGCPITDSDLTKLNSATAKKEFIQNYDSSADMKLVTIQVNWTVNGAPKQSKLETLFYRYGL
ncbi:hypothetical protein A2870_00240 [Candidatus Curtissbacteria bacterium RIFCSPHIGHO2_01_FULL_41_11]|uniref:Prepilin-type N-terminal cleavage/methylation domain-containing protein n=1 Tax=Candidatus Curtissbacteria bacterium RIFCSPHIGHO2_01_FULL_41_11 TaxID=1797711 RepID=A0A1F5G445_9BACT|nr:MAG: hypothetical protein A2870_00240 [Candidatus Curtissbacteria bacterium RIFCSPHIGHO2_01_FULL_41_11]